MEYIQIVKGDDACALPAKVEDVVAWSMTFRCVGTFANYLAHVRCASCALGHPPPPTGDPAIKRAVTAVAKRMLFRTRLQDLC